MRAMVLTAAGRPLQELERDIPAPGPQQVLIRVAACAVCRTDLHVVDGELPGPRLPLVPGHEIVGIVAARGANVTELAEGARVGVPWLGWTWVFKRGSSPPSSGQMERGRPPCSIW